MHTIEHRSSGVFRTSSVKAPALRAGSPSPPIATDAAGQPENAKKEVSTRYARGPSTFFAFSVRPLALCVDSPTGLRPSASTPPLLG